MAIPRDPLPDSTAALLREGYAYIPRRCQRFGSDVFEARLMLYPAVCISGAEAAAEFYKPDQITRRGGMPHSTFTLIQDDGSVMALDGEAHRVRKAMFLSLMGADAMGRLAALTERRLQERAAGWVGQQRVVLLPEIEHVFCQATAEWAGVVLPAAKLARLARDCAAMVDGTGSFGPRNVAGHWARGRVEGQMRRLIRRVRAGEHPAPEGSALAVIAAHRGADGRLLDTVTAAVELINVIRAGVADSRYVVFAAMAMHADPAVRAQVAGGDGAYLTAFAEEVRRFYPFIPFIGGRVLTPFRWRGRAFERGDWVLMDLYGTNRDARYWEEPERFRPQRFLGASPDPYAFVPSGAGDHAAGHRCPGEWITQAHIKAASRVLARDVRYVLPPQDLRIDLGRMPALPESRFVVGGVRMA